MTGEGSGPHPPSTGTGLRPPDSDLTAARLDALRTAQQLVEIASEVAASARAQRNALIVQLARSDVPYRMISLATAGDDQHPGLSVPAIGKITSAAGVTRYTRREPPPDEHRTS